MTYEKQLFLSFIAFLVVLWGGSCVVTIIQSDVIKGFIFLGVVAVEFLLSMNMIICMGSMIWRGFSRQIVKGEYHER